MNVSTLGPWMVAILVWTVYIIVPTANIIYGVVTIIRMKRIISGMGNLTIKLKSEKESHIVFTSLFSIIILISSLFLFIAVSKIIGLILFTVMFQSTLNALKGDLFSRANGVYQHGFILNDNPLMWTKIHSYKLIPDGRVSLLTIQGARVDMPEIVNFDLVRFIETIGIEKESL